MNGPEKSRGVRFADHIEIPVPTTTIATSVQETASSSETFNTGRLSFTPKISNVHYKTPDEREKSLVAPPSSLTRPNYEDNLRRVSVVINQHILKCESLMTKKNTAPGSLIGSSTTGIFRSENIAKFSEENFLIPKFSYQFVHSPLTRIGYLYGVVPTRYTPHTPTLTEIHTFLFDLFVKANLTAECSIGAVCYSSTIIVSIYFEI
jgi:hypothetical protein